VHVISLEWGVGRTHLWWVWFDLLLAAPSPGHQRFVLPLLPSRSQEWCLLGSCRAQFAELESRPRVCSVLG